MAEITDQQQEIKKEKLKKALFDERGTRLVAEQKHQSEPSLYSYSLLIPSTKAMAPIVFQFIMGELNAIRDGNTITVSHPNIVVNTDGEFTFEVPPRLNLGESGIVNGLKRYIKTIRGVREEPEGDVNDILDQAMALWKELQ